MDAQSKSENRISNTLGEFAAEFPGCDIPADVKTRAKHLILDAVGIAYASSRYEFASRTLAATTELGGQGLFDVIGYGVKLPLRDAVLMNGLLIHGLDYDDTHLQGVIHATASCFPTAMGVSASTDADGEDLLSAYIIGMEAAARLGSVAKGGFHQTGFHPTGLVGAFACTLIAGRLQGLNALHLAQAQGIALSLGSGNMEFLNDGAWTKRIHPGWAGGAGITAAALARQGFVGPKAVYEGRFGLFKSHLGPLDENCDYALATASLGKTWEVAAVAIKPIPACHFTHACVDAAAQLKRQHGIDPRDVAKIRALVPQEVIKTVCEPIQTKRRPQNSYDAQFSIPYAVAVALTHGRFSLAHLENDALNDPAVLELAGKVEYEADPQSGFPTYYSGEVVITLKDGRVLSHREAINRGSPDRPLTNDEIVEKYFENAQLVVSSARAEDIKNAVLSLETMTVRELASRLAGRV